MASADRRRWYQFRLRTLLFGVTAAAFVMVAYRTYVEPYSQQRRAMEVIEELRGTYQSSGPTAWQRRLFGQDHQNLVLVNVADCDGPDRYVPYIARLPAIETLFVGGEDFGDSHLRRLSGLSTLRALVLDCTSVSEEALAAWRERLPEVEVYRSQRRAIRKLQASGWVIVRKASSSGWPMSIRSGSHAALADAAGRELFFEADLAIGHPIEDAALLPLQHLTSLQTLSLADSKITDAGLRHLQGLAQLDYLDLTNTQVTDAGLAELKPFSDLVYLDLAGTQVTDDGLEHLRALAAIGWLNVSRTKVSYEGLLKNAAALKSLRILYIEGTQISAGQATALNKMLQPCAVFGPQRSSR